MKSAYKNVGLNQEVFMVFAYIPQSQVIYVEESHPIASKPFFYEYNGQVINLALAKEFFIHHIPLTNYYWPCVKIGRTWYYLADSMTQPEAQAFLRILAEKIMVASSK